MSLLKFLGLKREQTPPSVGDTETVRRIARELEAQDPDQARYLASFAYILSRVANADLEISDVETAKMEEIIQKFGHLSEQQAVLVVQIAKSQNTLFGHVEDFLVTREFKKISTPEQRLELLDCMFAVSAADDSISSLEETQIRQIANELGFSHEQYITARLAYSDKREVLKPFHQK